MSFMSSFFGEVTTGFNRAAPVATQNVQTSGDAVAPAQTTASTDTKTEVKTSTPTVEFSGYSIGSDGKKKTYNTFAEMLNDLDKIASSPCTCAVCDKTAQPVNQPEVKTEQPTENKQADKNTDDFLQFLYRLGDGPCKCTVCEASRIANAGDKATQQPTQPAGDAPANPAPQGDATENKNTDKNADIYKSLMSLMTGAAPKYSDSYRFTRTSMDNIPLMRPYVRMQVETGEMGLKSAFLAISKTDICRSSDFPEDKHYEFFDTEFIDMLAQNTSKNKTLQARVRFLTDSRSVRNKKKNLPSVYAPALLDSFKQYMESYSEQDAIRFHPDGLGYDVYADAVAIAQE